MSRCVGHCEGTTAPGILPFIRNRVISVHVSCVAPSLIGLHAFLHRVLFHFVPISFRPLSFSVRRNRTATKNKNPVKIQCSDSSALLSKRERSKRVNDLVSKVVSKILRCEIIKFRILSFIDFCEFLDYLPIIKKFL